MSEKEERWKSMDQVLAESEYSFFAPIDLRNLLDDYVELRDVPAIMAIAHKPLYVLWVWYFACRASPGMRLHSEKERIEYAIRMVWPDAPPGDIRDLTKLFTTRDKELEDAVIAMRNFRPEGRFMMHVACEQTIRIAKAIMNNDPEEIKTITDWGDKKKAIEAHRAALDMMHDAMQKSEHGFGITIKKKTGVRARGTALTRAHNSPQQEA